MIIKNFTNQEPSFISECHFYSSVGFIDQCFNTFIFTCDALQITLRHGSVNCRNILILYKISITVLKLSSIYVYEDTWHNYSILFQLYYKYCPYYCTCKIEQEFIYKKKFNLTKLNLTQCTRVLPLRPKFDPHGRQWLLQGMVVAPSDTWVFLRVLRVPPTSMALLR